MLLVIFNLVCALLTTAIRIIGGDASKNLIIVWNICMTVCWSAFFFQLFIYLT